MKKIYFSILGMVAGLGLSAQVAVTFSVDMTGQTVSPNGVHLAGNFNDPDEAGTTFPANYNAAYQNWTPSAIELTDGDMDMVYSVTLTLNPARYEFKFINDNNWGAGEESIPATCQVGGGNSNREIYVGSTADAYSVCWNSCAPCGQKAVRFRVDMTTQSAVSPAGVHVAGEFQNPIWQSGASPLRDRDGNGIWEGYYVVGNTSTFEYKFINGNDWGNPNENVSGSCSPGNGNRTVTLTDDNTILPVVCWASCDPCVEPSMITFRVNMTNSCIDTFEGVNLMGTVTDWGTGAAMSDADEDGIWELTLPVAPGTYDYKFRVGGGNWEGFPGGNRSITVVAGEDAVLDPFCWGLPTVCGPFNAPADITFLLAPPAGGVPSGQYCWLMGDFTGWQGGAIQMNDDDADGIWTTVVPDFCPQVLNFKFVVGESNTNTATNWLEETADFTSIGGCGVDNGTFSDNRTYTRTNADPVTISYTFNTCDPAFVSVEETSLITGVNVYPVPASQFINVSFNSAIAQNINARILNNLGQVVINQSAGTVSGTKLVTIDINALASGIYTLELTGSNGKVTKLISVK